LAVCDHEELRVVFWAFESWSATPFVTGIVKPGVDPCNEADRFCAGYHHIGVQTACALALTDPASASLLACLDGDPASGAIGIIQLGTDGGSEDRELARHRPVQLAAADTEIDDAAAIAVRDGDRIRLGWYLLGGQRRYQTVATGELGEPAMVAHGRAVLLVWPQRVAPTVAADLRSPIAGGGDPDGSAGGAGVLPRGIDRRSPIAGGGDPDGSAGGAGVLPRGIDRWVLRAAAAQPGDGSSAPALAAIA